MSDVPSGLDPELWADLSCAVESRRLFEAAGRPVAFWERVSLANAHRALVREILGRAGGEGSTILVDHLDALHRERGSLAEKLRELMSLFPLLTKDPDRVEMLIALVMISDKGREAARKWVDFPKAYNIEAAHTLRKLEKMVDLCVGALAERFPGVSLASSPSPHMEEAVFEDAQPAGAAPAPAAGIDEEILQDLRRVGEARKRLPDAAIWEIFCAVAMERDEGEAGVLRMREKYGRLVQRLREFIPRLQLGSFGNDTMELTIGFIVASPRGREAAEQWLNEPDRYRQQAAGKLEALISRAMKYQGAL